MAEMFGCKNRFTRMAILKKLVVLSLPVLVLSWRVFSHHDGILVSDRHYDHGIFSDCLISALKMPEVKDRDLSALETLRKNNRVL